MDEARPPLVLHGRGHRARVRGILHPQQRSCRGHRRRSGRCADHIHARTTIAVAARLPASRFQVLTHPPRHEIHLQPDRHTPAITSTTRTPTRIPISFMRRADTGAATPAYRRRRHRNRRGQRARRSSHARVVLPAPIVHLTPLIQSEGKKLQSPSSDHAACSVSFMVSQHRTRQRINMPLVVIVQ